MQKVFAWVLACLCLVFGSNARAQSGAGPNDGELNGNYAFRLTGFTGSSNANAGLAFVGRFTADGAGNVTAGEIDSNSAAGADVVTAQAFTGTYSIGADNRGTMTIAVGGTTLHWAFAMTASGNAQFIEQDATGGSGIIGSGTIEKSSVTASSNATITGDYAFGFAGFDAANARAAMVGRWTSTGAGTFTSGAADLNAYGTVGTATPQSPTYTITDSTNGRGTITMPFTFGGTSVTFHFVFYVVNSGRLLVMETDAVAGSTPLLNGTMVQQQVPAGGFTNASLNGGMVLSMTGRTVCNAGGPSAPDAIVGLVDSNAAGGFTLTYDENCGGGALNSAVGIAGTATVAANGRATLSFAGITEIVYLIGTNELFFLGTDGVVLFGRGDAQSAIAFSNGSVAGNYAGAATDPATLGVNIFSGEFSADGASPTGHLTGTVDTGNVSGPATGQAFDATYAISSSPTNERGAITITSGGTAVAYAISPTEFAGVLVGDANPSVWMFEQAPSGAAAVSLSAVSLNPTSVIGGQQNATGTVTLSGAAPTGGATVALTSSNAAANVPASVTVAAGATTATFTVSTAAVTAATIVTISASYGGATQTAALTVNPAPPPAVTVASLALNPTSVVGGQQNSTGTVTLSGAAPTGGATVALSSSNTAAAQVPASVTVAAGATTATFTATTSAVSTATPVTISGSYGGATQTATLTVNPVPPPPVTLASLTLSPTTVIGGQQNSTGTVTLSGVAPTGGATVVLTSSNNAAASVPASVGVAAGATTTTFTVSTSAVSAATAATISGSYGGTTKTASLTINPVPPPPVSIASLALNPTSVIGGQQNSTGTVTLNGSAPSGGAVTFLTSNNAAAKVPASVTIAAGATTATFTVTTSVVSAASAATISAAYGGTTRTATLTINPVPPPPVTVASLSLSPNSVIGGLGTSMGTVTLSAPAPAGGSVVSLSSSNGAASVPSTVFIPAGSTSASFTVNTAIVLVSTSANITATYNGSSKTATLLILL